MSKFTSIQSKNDYVVFFFISLFFILALIFSTNLFAEKVLTSTEELTESRDANSRIWINHYEEDELDINGNPTGNKIHTTGEIIEKGDNINYDIQDYSANPDASPIWVPTVTDIVSSKELNYSHQVMTGKAKVLFSNPANNVYNVSYEIDGESLKTGIGGVVYYDTESKKLSIIELPKNDITPKVEKNKLTYINIFNCGDVEYIYEPNSFKQNLIIKNIEDLPAPSFYGLNPSTTIIGLATRLDLQNYSRSVYNAKTDQLVSFSADTDIVDTNLSLEFKDAEGKLIHYFTEGKAYDSAKDFVTKAGSGESNNIEAKNPIISCAITKVLKKIQDKDIMIEGIHYNWLKDNKRVLPIVIDYESRTVPLNINESWQSGKTYFISDNYTIPAGKTLVIEGGAVVKIRSGRKISIQDEAKLIARGSKFNYIVVTGGGDDNVGETIPGEYLQYGVRYLVGFEITANSPGSQTNQSRIEYCKFNYGDVNIMLIGETIFDINENEELNNPISNCIFQRLQTDSSAILCYNNKRDAQVDVFNCLFSGFLFAIDVETVQGPIENCYLKNSVINCTFDNGESVSPFSYAVLYWCTSARNLFVTVDIRNNLVTRSGNGFGSNGYVQFQGDCKADYNGWWNVTNHYTVDFPGTHNNDVNITRQNGPYYIPGYDQEPLYCGQSPNGSFYTAYVKEYDNGFVIYPPYEGQRNTTVDTGDSSIDISLRNELSRKTICAPVTIFYENIDEDGRGQLLNFLKDNRSEFYNDVDEPDIGYHYDIVTAAMSFPDDNPITLSSNNLTFYPGYVISYEAGDSVIGRLFRVTSGAKLIADGSAANPIQFLSTYATGDIIRNPGNNKYNKDYYSAIQFVNGCNKDSSISFCEFNYAKFAVSFYEERTNNPIKNCVFKNNYYSIYLIKTHCDLMNNLFDNNNIAVYLGNQREEYEAIPSYLNFEGNTIHNCEKGLIFDLGEWEFSYGIINCVVEDNIFSCNDVAVTLNDSQLANQLNDISRNNLFWHNTIEIENSALDLDNYINYDNSYTPSSDLWKVCPMFVHKSITSDEILDYSNHNDGFYLAQTNRGTYYDVSKRPFRLEDNQLLDENEGINDVNDINSCEASIIVGTSESVPTTYTYTRGSYSEDGYQPGSQWEKGNVYIILVKNEKLFEAGENPYFDLKFDNGSELRVYLPSYCSMESDEDFLAFWIAEDGSTYQPNPLGEGEYYLSEVFQFDSPYAIRHKDNNLSRNALEGKRAIEGANAKSIAVDNGSVDFISDGTNCTDYDDDVPNVIDDEQVFDNDTQKFTKKLDIGYHYDCGQNDILTPYLIEWSGLIHPQKEIPVYSHYYNYIYYDLYPWVRNSHEFSVSTVNNPNTDENYPKESHTIVTYHTEGKEEDPSCTLFRYYGVLSYNYESGDSQLIKWHTYEDIIWHGEDFVLCPIVMNIASTSIPAGSIGQINHKGMIFAGYVCDWRGLYHTEGVAEPYQDRIEIWIYRYNSNNREWYPDPIAKVEWLMQGITNENGGHKITDVTLCAKGNDLWVFWTAEKLIYNEADMRWEPGYWYIYGGYVPNAVLRTNTEDLSDVDPLTYGPLFCLGQYDSPNSRIDCEYDEYYTGTPPTLIQAPRILISGLDYDVDHDIKDVFGARVILQNNIPSSLADIYNITADRREQGYDEFVCPAMTMNKSIFQSPTFDYKSFGVYGAQDEEFGYEPKFSEKCKLIDNVWDFWELVDSSAVTFNPSTAFPMYTDVTHRGFGSPRTCFRLGPDSDIVTNTERLTDPDLQSLQSNFFQLDFGSSPRMATNIENDTDIFIAIRADNPNHDGYGDGIIVTQIDP